MNGFVIIDKEPGMTSFFAASRLKKIYSEKKTGHTGTLDPMATGVLPVALGRATRFIDYLPDSNKSYYATFRPGIITDTLDITGEILAENEVRVSDEEIKAAVMSFKGESMQLPPMYSAVSVNGQRLYRLARQGIEIEREARKINVYSLSFDVLDNGEYGISVACSKGTYIRSLIADAGEKLGCGAVMTSLRRTGACGFDISQAHTLEYIRQNAEDCLISLDSALSVYKKITVSENQSKRFMNGGDLSCDRIFGFVPEKGLYRVYSPAGDFLGLGCVNEDNGDTLFAEKVASHE